MISLEFLNDYSKNEIIKLIKQLGYTNIDLNLSKKDLIQEFKNKHFAIVKNVPRKTIEKYFKQYLPNHTYINKMKTLKNIHLISELKNNYNDNKRLKKQILNYFIKNLKKTYSENNAIVDINILDKDNIYIVLKYKHENNWEDIYKESYESFWVDLIQLLNKTFKGVEFSYDSVNTNKKSEHILFIKKQKRKIKNTIDLSNFLKSLDVFIMSDKMTNRLRFTRNLIKEISNYLDKNNIMILKKKTIITSKDVDDIVSIHISKSNQNIKNKNKIIEKFNIIHEKFKKNMKNKSIKPKFNYDKNKFYSIDIDLSNYID